jgi:hypothetical protein
MTTTPNSARNSPPSFWEQAMSAWRDLVTGFGDPGQLLRWGWMRALLHRALGHDLRALENTVRGAIREDAGELVLPPLRPRAKRPDKRATQPRSHADDQPIWKRSVVFRMAVRAPGKRRGPRKRKEPREQRPCRGYAFRMEAVRRVITDCRPYVMRYARRLARVAQAARGPRDEFIAILRQMLGAPEDIGSGLVAFDVAPQNAKLIEPG